MPRTRRIQSETDLYHIMSRGVGRSIIYEDDDDRNKFLALLSSLLKKCRVTLHAWCLMDNHYHLLAKGKMSSISELMRKLNAAYALYFNERHDRVGHLFQGRFRSEPIESEDYYLTVLRYIHQNPVKALITPTCSYPWSSFDHYVDAPRLVDNRMALQLLRPEGFAEFHEYVDLASVCLDVGSGRRVVPDEEMYAVARAVLPDVRVEEIAGLERGLRDAVLRTLKCANLSTRQIERMTGIPKSVVSRA